MQRWSAGGLGLVMVAIAAGGASPQELRSQDVIDIVTIEIPTRVVDRSGRPVRGLGRENFEVTEGKLKHPVVRVEMVDLAATPDTGGRPWSAPVQAAARRRFLFLFDLSFSSAASVVKARDGVLQMIDEGLHPSDLVGVARYTASRGVEMVLGLTSDMMQARRAVESLGAVDPVLERNDPLRLVLVDLRAAVQESVGLPGGAGEGGGGLLAEAAVNPLAETILNLQDLAGEQSKIVRSEQSRPVLALASALTGLADHLGGIEGYKQVIFLSEGFDSSFLRGTADQRRIAELSEAAATGEAFRVDSEELYGGGAVRESLLDMAESFRRADCSIHAVDIGGLRTAADVRDVSQGSGAGLSAGGSEEGLFLMSEETGGRFLRNYNDLGRAMEEVLEQTSVTYVLILEPPNLRFDGAYHPVDVRVRKGPRGAEALHRPGFRAPRPYGSELGEIKRLRAADLLSAGEDGGRIATGVLAASFPTGGASADVVAWVEMYGHGLLDGHEDPRLPIEVFAYAFREDGTIADFASQAVVVDLTRFHQQIAAQGFKHVVRLALDPGVYQLRVLVRNAMTGATGLRTHRVEVPDFTRSSASLSPPMFIEQQGLWVLGWGPGLGSSAFQDYPLMRREERLVPSTDPVVPRGVELPLLMATFGFDSEPQRLEAELVPSGGGEIVPVAIVLDGYHAAGGAGRLWARIKASTLTIPGRYELKVQAGVDTSDPGAAASIPVFVR
jgi:VWFA-related protein